MHHIWKVGDIVRNVFNGCFGTLLSPWTGEDVCVLVMTHRGVEYWTVQDTRLLEIVDAAQDR